VTDIPELFKQRKVIVKLDSQILNSIDLCGARYEMEHVGNYRPNKKAPALEKGSVMHDMLKYYYEQRMKGRIASEHGQVIDECMLIGRELASMTQIPVEEFSEEDLYTFKEYILHHQYDGWEILGVEEPFTRILYDSDDLKILYEGIVDLRVIDPKIGQAVVDHKTESRKSHPFALGNQFLGYNWTFNSSLIINKIGYQKTLENRERFRRIELPHRQYLIDEWKEDTIRSVRKAIQWHKEDYFPKNRTSCDKYSGCIFKKVCENPEENREYKLNAFFYKDKPWDPYTRDDE
jgi:PD-(D/E)XK nuclease superfamily